MKYMYLESSIKKLKHSVVLILLLFTSGWVKAQSADFAMTPEIACSGIDLTSINVTTSGLNSADILSYTIRWGIPNDTSVNARILTNAPNPYFSKIYTSGGNYSITLVVKRTSGNDIVVTKNRKVWERPKTSFVLTSPNNQCFKNNSFCFTNTSSKGDASLVKYEWTFGDGNARQITDTSIRNLCHKYALNNPSYLVGLRITDSVGCQTDPTVDPLSSLQIYIAPNINPGFSISGQPKCDTSKYIFTNTTPLSYTYVRNFTWDYGDGTTYVSGLPHTNFEDLTRWKDPYTHPYTIGDVFHPFLIVQDKRSNCIDTFYYEKSGLTLPENIIPQIEILTKRSITNDSIADSICLVTPGAATVTLYNKYELQGAGGAKLGISWHFHDANANPPGSDVTPFVGVLQPTYIYKGLGQFFPTLTVVCPGSPARTYNYFSKIDTLPKDKKRYQYEDYNAAPRTDIPQFTNPNGPIINPILYTRKGRILSPNSLAKPQFFNYNGKISNYQYDTIVSPVDPTLILSVYAKHIGWADSMSTNWDFFRNTEDAFINKWVDTNTTTFRNPFTGVLITVPIFREYSNPVSRRTAVNYYKDSLTPFFNLIDNKWDTAHTYILLRSIFNDTLIGLGVQILGPQARIEFPQAQGGQAPPKDVILDWQKSSCMCKPTDPYPVNFVNNSLIYQSDRVWLRWDFAETRWAPACTSYSIPNPSAANFGKGPYETAGDMQARTLGGFIANGKAYLGRLNNCNFSHDSLPLRQYTNWDVAFNWFKYGHDFPPYDSTKWTKGYTVWPSAVKAPTGFDWVQPQDSGQWNKQMRAVGPTPTRIDTMQNIWPADIPVNNLITLNKDIPDPISASRGNWMDVIPNGTRIDSGNLLISLPKPSNDKKLRRYRGSDIIPGISPPITLYKYAFLRQIVQDYSVTLQLKDSLNNISGDPDYRQVKTKFDTIKIYDPITKALKDSIVKDSLFLDDWDCKASNNITLNYVRPDAFGLGQDGKICPGFKNGVYGGDPQLIFNADGYLDSAKINNAPGILPASNRTFLQINYDSLLDRHDGDNCNFNLFVPAFDPNGATTFTIGGLKADGITPADPKNPLVQPARTFPIMYTSVGTSNSFPTQPPQFWSSASGTKAFLHYFPSGIAGGGIENMPTDKKGYVTLGLVVGNGCNGINCGTPDPLCGISDTVWYHNFFRFIQLDGSFTIERFQYEFNNKPELCYLRGKGDDVTFHYFDSIQDNIVADKWEWGDGTATVDTFYYQPDNDVPYGRTRFNFNTMPEKWQLIDSFIYPVGTRISRDTVINKIRRCDDINEVLPFAKIDTVITRRDSALMLIPITHKYTKSSFEQVKPSGTPGIYDRPSDITNVVHTLVANNYSRCEERKEKYIVIGVIDTFDIKNSKGEWDTVFCQGETVYFYDSIRYWYPAAAVDCSRPLGQFENLNDQFTQLKNDQGNMHNWAYTKYNYPLDSIKTNITWDPNDYIIKSGINPNVCPILFLHGEVGPLDPNAVPIVQVVRCYRNREYFHERIYWDFESDGNIDFSGVNPTHKYNTHGRYKVSMISRDSTGRWDTCIQFVNVVKPVAFIGANSLYTCADRFAFRDSSIIYDDFRITTGVDSLDRIAGWKWWFGDRKYYPKAPQSILKNPEYDYRRYGKYTLRLAINTEQGCTDTAFKDIFISGPRPHLVLLDDTLGCVPHKLRVVSIPERESWSTGSDTFTKLTILRSGRPDNYSVPIKYSKIDTVEFIYDQPGIYYIRAEAFDDVNGAASACKPGYFPDTVDGFQNPIKVYVNVPYKVDLETSKEVVCVGEIFKVKNLSDRDTISRFRMDVFNTDYTLRLDSILKTDYITDTAWQYKFNQIGKYRLVLNSVKFEKGFSPCPNHDTATVIVKQAKADFTATANGEANWKFTNTSDTAVSDKYTWKIFDHNGNILKDYPINFDEASPLNIKEQVFNIDSTESFTVCIYADVDGVQSCPDSVCKIVEVIVPKGKINIPNVFTPNDDKVNDVFKVDISGQTKYHMLIWNRWGNTVFESGDADKMWNGKTNNDGGENPAGTYYYLFTYQLRGGTEKTIRGTVTLIR